MNGLVAKKESAVSYSAIVVRDGDESYRLLISPRDWGLLWGPFFKEGPLFSVAFGVLDNFSVAEGVPGGAQVTRKGRTLENAARVLLLGLTRDADLLNYDYAYGFAGDRTRYGEGQSIQVRGLSGQLSVRPKGYCSIELFDPRGQGSPRIAEFIDLRIVQSIKTDKLGVVKVFRKKAPMSWLETLPPFIEFLSARRQRSLVVEHFDKVGAESPNGPVV